MRVRRKYVPVNPRPKVSVFKVFIYGLKFMATFSPKWFIAFCVINIIFGLSQGFNVLASQFLFDSVENVLTNQGAISTVYYMLLVFGLTQIIRDVFNRLLNFIYSASLYGGFEAGLQKIRNRKISLIDPIAFENVDFHDDIEKADQGKWAVMGLTVAIVSLFVFYIPYFVFIGFYLHNLSPVFIFAIILVFVPTLLGQIIRTKITAKFVDITAPIRRKHDMYYNAISNAHYYKETRLLGAYGFFLGRFKDMMRDLRCAELSVNRKTNLLNIVVSLLSTAGYAGILFMLVTALLNGEISVGAFAAVYGSVGMMFDMMESLIQRNLGRAAEEMGFAHNWMRFLDLPERKGDSTTQPEMKNGIIANNISFTYPLAKSKSIDHISLEIKEGETVAIVGGNGAGKSTLVRLLIGLYTPCEGNVIFGGLNTKDTKLTTLFANLSGVFQRFMRYALTLKENVQMGDTSSNNEITTALSQAGLELDEKTFPQGQDTMLSREFDGVEISGGQWQRVAIARGLYRTHNVVVLDEPTAAIDPIEESRIYEKFIEISKNKTAIIVTHRLGSIKIADRVIVMDAGKIVDAGKHEELLERDGLYKEMFNAQAMWY